MRRIIVPDMVNGADLQRLRSMAAGLATVEKEPKIVEPTNKQIAAVEWRIPAKSAGRHLQGAPGSTIQASDREYFVAKDGSLRRIAWVGGKK